MNLVRIFLIVSSFLALQIVSRAQQKDSLPGKKAAAGQVIQDSTLLLRSAPASGKIDQPYKVDSAARKKHNPRKATLYSTFLPGLGQIYNRKYWKLPLVYAAVGIPAYTYFYNKSWYNKCQFALSSLLDSSAFKDPAVMNKIDPKLRPLVQNGQDNSLRSYRNSYRQDQDYSVLFFLLFWGLNIVDATVDAHLMNFDVSNTLSFRVHPGFSSFGAGLAMGNGLAIPGSLGLIFDLHKGRNKTISMP